MFFFQIALEIILVLDLLPIQTNGIKPLPSLSTYQLDKQLSVYRAAQEYMSGK